MFRIFKGLGIMEISVMAFGPNLKKELKALRTAKHNGFEDDADMIKFV